MAAPPYSVAQEIDYLAKLTGLPCSQFRHMIVTANREDPMGEEDVPVREAHLFTDEDGAAHQAFDNMAGQVGGIERKWDCKPEAGRPAGLCYLVQADRSSAFEQMAAANGLAMAWGVDPVTKALVNYIPPENLTWIVTWIQTRSYNPTTYLEAAAAQMSEQVGDMRSESIDWNGQTTAWINVRTTPIVAELCSSIWLNGPVLLAFKGGNRVRLFIRRGATSLPESSFQIQVRMHGYLAPPEAYTCLADNVSKIEQHTATG